MNKGKIPYNSLIRSVLRAPFLQKEAGAAARDGAFLSEESDAAVSVNTTVYGGENAEAFAFYRSLNSALAAGILPESVFLSITAPVSERESRMKARMEAFQKLAVSERVRIAGGHTTYSGNVSAPVISVTATGKKQREAAFTDIGNGHKPLPGDTLILTKFAGDAGALLFYQEEKDMLEKRFSPAFLTPVQEVLPYLSCRKEAEILREAGAVMHDVSEGGILGALWEFAECYGVGFTVDELSIPVHQETVEICECFGANPYALLSTGCMLAAVRDGEETVGKLHAAGVPAAAIGHVDSGVKKLLMRGEEAHFLDRPQPDPAFTLNNFG